MSYTGNFSGHCADEDTEKKLHAELVAVLEKPEYGCGTSYFGGSHVNGTIHLHNAQGTEHVHEREEAAEPQPL